MDDKTAESPDIEVESAASRKRRRWLVELGIYVSAVVFGVLAMMAWPAINETRTPASGVLCLGRLKHLAIALANFELVNGHFPPAYVADEFGNPMHSWRVLLLPHLEAQELYDQYDFGQPWDSPHNLEVAEQIPVIFRCPDSEDLPEGHTSYLAVVGPGCVFNGENRTTVAEINDGLATTLALAESHDTSVFWTEPRDLDAQTMKFVINGGPGEIGGPHVRGAAVAFCDGHTTSLHSQSPASVKAMTTIAGGEPADAR